MGHKLSAVSYWVYGFSFSKNPTLKTYIDSYEGKSTMEVKKTRYTNRYSFYKKPGFKCVDDREAVNNRHFMYDCNNYRFEFSELNEQNGREESSSVKYNLIFSKGAKYHTLKEYRTARNDKETTPIIKKDLSEREEKLAQEVKNPTYYNKFIKK